MNEAYKQIKELIIPEKTITENCIYLYDYYKKNEISEHVIRVGEKAVELGSRSNFKIDELMTAAYLHDISGVIDRKKYLDIVDMEKIEVCDEEKKYPLLLHQKISRNIAEKCFDIDSENVLSAIECHTTLKAHASLFDMIIFISDKLEWDQKDKPGYYDEVNNAIGLSIKDGVAKFLEYQMKNKESMLIIHPWLNNAFIDICKK